MSNFLRNYLNLTLRFTWQYILLIIILLKTTFTYLFNQKTRKLHKDKNNIIINGDISNNKGAQAMTFTVVDQLKKRFPNKYIYVLYNSDIEKENKAKNTFNFNIFPLSGKLRIILLSKFFRCLFKFNDLKNKLELIIRDTEFIIDISGFRLTSSKEKHNWIFYILDIMLARKYAIPFYIFPQSIGPFNFKLRYKLFFYPLAKFYLNYPKKIFLREYDGMRYINQFRRNNIKKSHDIVLQQGKYDLSNLYKKSIKNKNIQIMPNSVCIIPNFEVMRRVNPSKIYSIYKIFIEKLIETNRVIYLLRYSREDLKIIIEIKNYFPINQNIKLITEDLNIFELENVIKNFDFIITSRYHSIIHSYKNGIPAFVIGWNIKYYELMKLFGQDYYFSDIKDIEDIKKIESKFESIIREYRNDSKKIVGIVNNILKEETCFNHLKNQIHYNI